MLSLPEDTTQREPTVTCDRLSDLLSRTHDRLRAQPTTSIIDEFALQLDVLVDIAASQNRLDLLQTECRKHLLFDLILKDPYSRRAFEKPRGYAGDAVMMDFIYNREPIFLDSISQTVYDFTTNYGNAKSVKWRRDYIADEIISLIYYGKSVDIMSVASGHMRELDRVRAICGARNARFVAIDRDYQSILRCFSDYPDFPICGAADDFRQIIRGRYDDLKLDMIYSAGLFDYLPDAKAIALIKALVKLLKTDGALLIGNFTPDSHGRGYMAAFMDWMLIYRDENQLEDLVRAAAPGAARRIFRDDPGNVVYAEIRR